MNILQYIMISGEAIVTVKYQTESVTSTATTTAAVGLKLRRNSSLINQVPKTVTTLMEAMRLGTGDFFGNNIISDL